MVGQSEIIDGKTKSVVDRFLLHVFFVIRPDNVVWGTFCRARAWQQAGKMNSWFGGLEGTVLYHVSLNLSLTLNSGGG